MAKRGTISIANAAAAFIFVQKSERECVCIVWLIVHASFWTLNFEQMRQIFIL